MSQSDPISDKICLVLEAYEKAALNVDENMERFRNYHCRWQVGLFVAQQVLIGGFTAASFVIFYKWIPTMIPPFSALAAFGVYLVLTLATFLLLSNYADKRRRLFTEYVLRTEFSDISTLNQFLETVIKEPERAQIWRAMQSAVAKYGSIDVDDAGEKRLTRICRATELPATNSEILYTRLSRYRLEHSDKRTVKDGLCFLLPKLSAAGKKLDAPFSTFSDA